MKSTIPQLVSLFLILLLFACADGDEPKLAGDVEQVAAKIDELLASHWQSNDVKPAAPADDATFLRRVTLDLAGRIPTVGELDRFLADKSTTRGNDWFVSWSKDRNLPCTLATSWTR